MLPPLISAEVEARAKIHLDFTNCFNWLPEFEKHICVPSAITTGDTCAGYRSAWLDFSIQVSPASKKCYILYIEINPAIRRRGMGRQLVADIEKFAKMCGCEIVEATPSGMGLHFFPAVGYQWCGQVVQRWI